MSELSFIESMRTTANNKEEVAKFIEDLTNRRIEENKKKYQDKIASIKDEKFKFLTAKYYERIKDAIVLASNCGKTEKYMNFTKDDFKANFPGLGYPSEFQKQWLDELSNPESNYVPVNSVTGKKQHFHGLKYKIWNNNSFTTVFNWNTESD
jgi:hypothetical protein